jgi:hypothetical protein
MILRRRRRRMRRRRRRKEPGIGTGLVVRNIAVVISRKRNGGISEEIERAAQKIRKAMYRGRRVEVQALLGFQRKSFESIKQGKRKGKL